MLILSDYNFTNEAHAELEEFYNLLSEMYSYLAYEQKLIQENVPNDEIEKNRDYIEKIYIAVYEMKMKLENTNNISKEELRNFFA